jgi:hypothetical protein
MRSEFYPGIYLIIPANSRDTTMDARSITNRTSHEPLGYPLCVRLVPIPCTFYKFMLSSTTIIRFHKLSRHITIPVSITKQSDVIEQSSQSIAKRPFSTLKMKAIVIDPKSKSASLSRDRAPPKLRDDYILVKTVAVALNPTDWKHIAGGIAAEEGLSGCDYAGVVEEVGKSVTKAFKKGDRICGCVFSKD